MASSKDTFESATFLSDTFACGTFRGVGPSVIVPDTEGLEYTLPTNRPHHTLRVNRMHHTEPTNKMHYTLPEDTG